MANVLVLYTVSLHGSASSAVHTVLKVYNTAHDVSDSFSNVILKFYIRQSKQ